MKFRLILLLIAGFVAVSLCHAQSGLNRYRDVPDWRVPGKIIFKVKPQLGSICRVNQIDSEAMRRALETARISQFGKKFPLHAAPAEARSIDGQRMVDLSTIYEGVIPATVPIEKAIRILMASGMIEYAEPVYRMEPLYNPDDPDTASQYYLGLIQAYQAWDITKGDSNMVVGVTDTGTDLDHPDLAGGIKYNYNDPINGVDDDNDGYVDNFMGWDVGQNDNDPSIDIVHGSFVCGLAGAVTDNGTGIAGTGFHTRFLPVKISNNGVLTAAYEGVVYAADHGCQIINCSWGGFGGGQFGQDIMDYATINKNALVVGASGNSNNENPFYPASYNNVLSVTGTNSTDTKWVNSSYGAFVDMSAPGEGVYSTIFDDNYSFSSGTSFAAPIVAAAAGLVKTQFAFYTPGQLAEQLRATCDDIYGVPGNASYNYKLGKGRLNIYRALTESPKSVRMEDRFITDNNDNAFAGNDTLDITLYLKNYLAPLSNLNVTLSCTDPNITILSNSVQPGFMNTLSTYNNTGSPFRAVIGSSVPFNTKVTFVVNFTDGTYSDWQIFDLVVNVDYINVLVNDVGTSITSKGRIGYNIAQGQGIGFTYNDGSSLLYEGGLIVATDSVKVSDHLTGDPVSILSDDFYSVVNVHRNIPSVYSDFDLESIFNDDGAGGNKLDVDITQKTYAWSTPADSKYIIVEFTISNTGTSLLSDLYAGIYADWDIGNVVDNHGIYDAGEKLGYVFNNGTPTYYCGIKQLTSGGNTCYAVDNDGAGGGVNIYNGISELDKFEMVSTTRPNAGQAPAGNDVSIAVSSGPHTINVNDSVTIAFALLAGEDLASLQASGDAAEIKYTTLHVPADPTPLTQGLSQNYPNPFGGETTLQFVINSSDHVVIDVINSLGERVYLAADAPFSAGTHQVVLDGTLFANGIYTCRMLTSNQVYVTRMMKVD